MKFQIDQPIFEKLLSTVSRAVDGHPMLPVLANIHLIAVDGILVAIGTSIELTIRSQVECVVEDAGAITLPARELNAMVSSFDKRLPITLTLDADSATMRLKSGKTNFKLNGISADEFPALQGGEAGHVFTFQKNDLIRAIKRTVYAADPNAQEMARKGVSFHFMPDDVQLFANDKIRMAQAFLRYYSDYGLDPATDLEVIVPMRSLVQAADVLSSSSGGELVTISLVKGASMVHFDDGEVLVSSQLYDGKLARDLKTMLPASTTCVEMNSLALKTALKRMNILSADSNNGCVFKTEDGMVLVSARSSERGEAQDEIEAVLDGVPLELMLNTRFLMDALDSFSGSERVQLKGHRMGAKAWEIAVSLQSATEPDLMAVMSPMSVKEN